MLTDLFSFLREKLGKKWVTTVFVVTILWNLTFWAVVYTRPDNKFHLYFFDVGQGDSIFIKTPKNYQILIDGGPDQRVLERLGQVLPFWDRSIDLVILTHPQADHATGLVEVLRRYKIGKFVYNPTTAEGSEITEIKRIIADRKIEMAAFLAGEQVLSFDGVSLVSLWPDDQMTIFEAINPNQASTVIRGSYQDFSVLLTGDAELGLENPILEIKALDWEPVEILQIPHHGSKNAVGEGVLQQLHPKTAVISVGQNSYGHPNSDLVKMLEDYRVDVWRTDEKGTFRVIK